ncbi:MAG TPA: hypothetical protein DEQ84_05310 [Prevotellaceae bacterium]|nr:hypothetical protein [Prevotellaceae bacterium]
MNIRQNVIGVILLSAAMLMSCSTTDKLQDGETLYTGIGSIMYMDKGEKTKKNQADSAGVIRAIADAAEQVDQIVKGGLEHTGNVADNKKTELSKEERAVEKARQRADAEALETAATEVNAVLEYAPNNSLFGSSYHRAPFPTGLWAYNAFSGKQSGFSKWMYKTFAGNPVLISTVNPATRIKVATNTLHNYGYFRGKVDYDILHDKGNEKKAKINYYITTGKVYRLDSIAYKNFPERTDSLIRRNMKETYLHKGDAFSVVNLSNEQTRLEKLFRNQGYYYYKANFATYKADTLMKPYKVQLVMQPKKALPPFVNKPWYIRRTVISVYNNENDSLTQTRKHRSLAFNFNGKKSPLHPIVWLQNIAHRPGSLYRQSDEEKTQEMLSSLGIFSQLNISYVRQDTTSLCDSLDLHIDAVLDKPYASDFEMNVTEKNSERIGPGLSWSLQRKNAFRGAELVNFKIYGSYEWRTTGETSAKDKFFNSYNLGTQLSFDFPRIIFPGISRRQFRFSTSTSFVLTADWLNRAGYFNLFSSGFSVKYGWNKTKTSKHELTPFSLTYDKLINSTQEFDSIMQVNPVLYVSMRNRFVPSMQYVYTYVSGENHRNPLWWQVTIKEAGNFTSAVYALAGKEFGEKNKNLFGNPFAQYLKISTELHNTFRIHREYKFVTRLMAGAIWSYGNSTVAPYSDQFFVGGANSVRGFTIRTIGPGSYYAPHSKYSYMDQTGDIKLEGNIEFRFPLFGSLYGAAFLDAGNVWLMREDEMRPGGKFRLSNLFEELALGTGMGLRYDMDFLVLRLDLGVALHDPANRHKSGYYNIGKFKDGLALHFAIGYPF